MCSQKKKKEKAHEIAHIEHSSWFSNKLKGIGLPEFSEQPPSFKRQCKNPASSPCETVMIHKKSRSMFMAIVPKCIFKGVILLFTLPAHLSTKQCGFVSYYHKYTSN